MGYRVIEEFCDMQDHDYKYSVGDTYPRRGMTLSKNRAELLSTDHNKLGRPLIKLEAVEEVVPKEIPKEDAPIPKEDVREAETSVNAPKAVKAKRSTKKS